MRRIASITTKVKQIVV